MESIVQKKLPVTLISGFLGSGKTTLLQHILTNKDHKLKCAVIVNDMASINIDGALIEQSQLVQEEEKLVQMENGCICCTLRLELMEEINQLAKEGRFDYLIIESTGISEPMQVAQNFSVEFVESLEEEHKEPEGQQDVHVHSDDADAVTLKALKQLADSARLDTCVSLVDASNFFEYFNSSKFASETFDDVAEQDERTIVDLLVDQIEFADVIIMNKLDTCSAEKADQIQKILQGLNSTAKIIRSKYSSVDVQEIINTGLFNMKEAVTSASWIRSLKEDMISESEEYGISSFVYHQRKPFHPKRIFELVKTAFLIIEDVRNVSNDNDEKNDHDHDGMDDDEGTPQPDGEDMVKNDEEDEKDSESDTEMDPNLYSIEEGKKCLESKQQSVFAHVLRSKGFIWIAKKDKFMASWSQAGIIMTISNAKKWFIEMSKEELDEEDDETRQYMTKNFMDGIGDRRQEIVLIGDFKDTAEKDQLIAALDHCLMQPNEVVNDDDDPWEEWE